MIQGVYAACIYQLVANKNAVLKAMQASKKCICLPEKI
jgi:hypothetical protein